MSSGTRPHRWILAITALALGLVVALGGTGCSGGSGGGATPRERTPEYVALGDSYTSGAGLDRVVVAAGQCAQSRLAYPHLVAEAVGGDLVDMSCGGASTANGSTPQSWPDGSAWPAQLSGLTTETELVTVGIGFNDDNLYGDALFGCTDIAARDPEGSPCRDDPRSAGWAAEAEAIGARVAAYLLAVQDRAPDARVVLVGYPQLVPATGTCAELPLAAGDYPFVRGVISSINDAERRAAETAGARYVDVEVASAGHDICAGDQAWINGVVPEPRVAAAYHPLAVEQEAVARLVLSSLA